MRLTFLSLNQGKEKIYVNMNLVSHILSNGGKGSVLYFVGVLENEPLYITVDESPEEIGSRPEWNS